MLLADAQRASRFRNADQSTVSGAPKRNCKEGTNQLEDRGVHTSRGNMESPHQLEQLEGPHQLEEQRDRISWCPSGIGR